MKSPSVYVRRAMNVLAKGRTALYLFTALSLVMSLALFASPPKVVMGSDGTVVTLPDANLEAAIRGAIGKPVGDIYESDLAGLTNLDASYSGIADLTGMEYCTSLTELDLGGNQISDLSPLSSLTSLTVLGLYENQISDLSSLSSLTSLTVLGLWENQISDISSLSSLTSLTYLDLGGNQISDLSSLSSLTSLTVLGLYENQISDLSPLSSLTSLTWLSLDGNEISDIGPLSSLISLTELYLDGNQISDIGPLVNNAGLSDGDTVDLTGNPLSLTSIDEHIPVLEARGVTVLWGTVNHSPNTPSNVSPDDGATGVALTPMLASSAFSDPDSGDTHAASQWQITTTAGDYATPVFDGGTDAVNLTQIDIPLGILNGNTTYYWRVRHQDNHGAWSEWSAETSFSTEGLVVTFPDANLEAAIREAIGKPVGDIYASDLAGLTNLDAYSRGIADLTGMEYCTSLTWLNLNVNQISDISPLSSLTSLTTLGLGSNQISDISPLSSLTSLSWLGLEVNQISDISPLSSLTSLTDLGLCVNQISDLSPLSSLTSLTDLGLCVNQISDLSPLSSLTSLTWLDLGGNEISDLSPLSSLTSLTVLDLEVNQISDIEPLVNNAGLSEGDVVDLRGNPLSLTSVDEYIPALEARGVTVLWGTVNHIFDDQFGDPTLNPDWVISPGKGSYSLTDNPGYLRYIIDAYGWESGAIPLQLIRPFSGERWILTTAITYNMRPAEPTNNRNMHFFIRAPGATGAPMVYTLRSVGVNDDNPYSNAMILYAGDNSTPILFPNSPNPLPLERWYFEIERNKDHVAVRASNDGDDSTFEYQCEYTFPSSVLGNDQEIVIQASGWYGSNDPPGYADFDFIKTELTSPPPTTPVVADDGAYTTNTTQLHATWSASDSESGIAEYQYAIGTSAGGTNVVNWTSAGTNTGVTHTGLSLTAGTAYYFAVKAKNGAGLWSEIGVSNGITCDNTLPTTPAVTDDGAYTTSTTQLHATWSASDSESGIAEYQYAIGTSAGGTNVVNWTSAGTNTGVTHTGLSLTAGTTYYFAVKAKNGAGLWSEVGVSDGITVIQASPTVTSINPSQGNQGQSLNVTIGGTNFTGATAVSFGSGITVNSFTVDSNSQITTDITISGAAAPGARDVSVTTPAGTGKKTGGFTVKERAGEAGGCSCSKAKASTSTSQLLIGWGVLGLCLATCYGLAKRVSKKGRK